MIAADERTRAVARALARLEAPAAVLAPDPHGRGFGVFPTGDRRRRPLARLSAAEVRHLESEGAIAPRGEEAGYVLTEAGRARARRATAAPAEAFAAQHGPLTRRTVMDADGALRHARGYDAHAVGRRLAMLRDAGGGAWLSPAEIAAAERLRQDWEQGQIGLARTADWSAPPRSGTPRGGGAAQERAMAAGCDARARVEQTLGALAPPLRRVVERVCLHEDGLEALERRERWPARSGKIALKLGLAQLAEAQRRF